MAKIISTDNEVLDFEITSLEAIENVVNGPIKIIHFIDGRIFITSDNLRPAGKVNKIASNIVKTCLSIESRVYGSVISTTEEEFNSCFLVCERDRFEEEEEKVND